MGIVLTRRAMVASLASAPFATSLLAAAAGARLGSITGNDPATYSRFASWFGRKPQLAGWRALARGGLTAPAVHFRNSGLGTSVRSGPWTCCSGGRALTTHRFQDRPLLIRWQVAEDLDLFGRGCLRAG